MDFDVVEQELLIEGLDDWIGLWRFARDTRDENPGAPTEEVRARAMRRVRRLVGAGYMRPGTLTKERAGFSAWELDPEAAIERIDREWRGLGRDPNIPDICWFSNTDKGDQVARTLTEAS